MLPYVSIVVIVYNMQETIAVCLRSLSEQRYPKERYEIIVVDGGSDDGTREIVGNHEVKLVVEPRQGRGLARNVGIAHAKGDIIAFVDADCTAAADWLRFHVTHYDDEAIGAVGGAIVNPYLSYHDIFTLVDHYENFAEFNPNAPRRYMYHIPTCNASYRRNVLREVGGFEEKAHRYEDYILSQKIAMADHKILFEPSAVVSHLEKDLSPRDYFDNALKGGRWHYRAQQYCANMVGNLPTNKLVALFLFPSIILARSAREVYKLKYARRLSNFGLAPLLFIGGCVWGFSYLREAFTWQGDGDLV